MASSPLSLSGLLNELLAEDDAQASSIGDASAGAPAEARLAERAPTAGADDSALAGLLEEMEQRGSRCLGDLDVACSEDRTGTRSSPASGGRPATAVPRPWALLDGARAAAVVSLGFDQNRQFRDYMEDGSKVRDPFSVPGCGAGECWGFYAVYDGHGGREATDYCESRLHEQVLAEMQTLSSDNDVSRVLSAAFQKIDSQLAMYGAWGHGCTATVALVHRKQGRGITLHVANVGDSRAVLLCGSGASRLSRDHRPDDPDEAKRVVREGGRVIDGRVGADLAISRSLGDHRLKCKGVSSEPDTTSCSVAHGHALIIASDGLWDVLSDAEACEALETCVQRGVELCMGQVELMHWLQDNAASELVDRAKRLGSEDNILVLVVFL